MLKDAYSTAIYGSRGTAGVILITTKKGARGKMCVDAQMSVSFNRPRNAIIFCLVAILCCILLSYIVVDQKK
ncbi:hypothetical protein [Pinibacter aurantiacus]|uniref:hypothetical protein n=1 Tax=Pinibacter aurantiacus TaxID=2851599 RepID=UPI00293D74E4|nr:hypothetical protein [Pinibacter aurantiacus]